MILLRTLFWAMHRITGYANSTTEDAALVINHSVTISGLNSNTTYYYRTVSQGSPEAVGAEKILTTNSSGSAGSGGSSNPYTLTCGDHILDMSYEQCDDGNKINGDGCCSSTCKTELKGEVKGVTTFKGVDPADYGLKDGSLIRATGDINVYIVNQYGYKRLFLSPIIFGMYSHLGGWKSIIAVTPETRDAFVTSRLTTVMLTKAKYMT